MAQKARSFSSYNSPKYAKKGAGPWHTPLGVRITRLQGLSIWQTSKTPILKIRLESNREAATHPHRSCWTSKNSFTKRE